MSRAAWPPTPSSSTDLHGKDGSKQMASLQLAFELPPPAMTSSRKTKTPESPVSQSPPKTPYPIQPSEAVKSRKRSSAATTSSANSTGAHKDSFALPPPPTRSRKIIQMKPRTQESSKPVKSAGAGAGRASTGSSKKVASAGATIATTVAAPAASEAVLSKKKQPSATSVAGRKIARKTAHSLIERRRRSKMNEEFAVLKSMIPACEGEMHKLAILQASIEYVRYLQDCIEKLKTQRRHSSSDIPTNPDDSPCARSQDLYDQDSQCQQTAYTPEEHSSSPDVEMTGSDEPISPTCTALPSSAGHVSHQYTESPSIPAQDPSTDSPVIHRNGSYSSVYAATFDSRRHYSFSTATASPAFGPQQAPTGAEWYAASSHSACASTATSPALGPSVERDLDQEAMAALLMLNSDRRGMESMRTADSDRTGSSTNLRAQKPRGMSVKDLLSA